MEQLEFAAHDDQHGQHPGGRGKGSALRPALNGADALQNNFQGLQSRYAQGLVASSIKNDTISNVPALLNRLINTTTINFQSSFAKPVDTTTDVQVPSDFFIFHSALTMPQSNLSFTMPALTITRSMHDALVCIR